MTLVLRSRTDLARASRVASWLHRTPIDHVIVSLPWLDSSEQLRAARSLRSHFNDCGCAEGTVAFVLVLALCVWTEPWAGAAWWVAIASTFLSAFLSAVPAKLAAVLWSRWRLRALLSRLARAEPR